MISGELEVNLFTLIRIILEVKFEDDLLMTSNTDVDFISKYSLWK